jgi:hypothetical protein
MAVTVPSWFKGRQGKAEEAGPRLLKLTAPNLKDWFLGIEPHDDGHWRALLRDRPDGPDAASVDFDAPREFEAWEAAFEVYRTRVVT